MRNIPFYVADSFTRTPYTGNPAGVFLDTDGLSEGQMMRMAAEVSLESAFVSQGPDGLALRYFTATAEVPLCGHATVAAFAAMACAGRVAAGASVPFTCPAGRLSVRLRASDEGLSVRLRQAAPVFGRTADAEATLDILLALGATPHHLHPALPVQVVSTGSPFLFVPVAREAPVDGAPGDLAAIAEVSRRFGAHGVYVFALHTQAPPDAPMVRARNFCPASGLDEDPVTGSASGALGCYLARHGALPPERAAFISRQGRAPRQGHVTICVERDAAGAPCGVETEGAAVLVAEGTVRVPDAD